MLEEQEKCQLIHRTYANVAMVHFSCSSFHAGLSLCLFHALSHMYEQKHVQKNYPYWSFFTSTTLIAFKLCQILTTINDLNSFLKLFQSLYKNISRLCSEAWNLTFQASYRTSWFHINIIFVLKFLMLKQPFFEKDAICSFYFNFVLTLTPFG